VGIVDTVLLWEGLKGYDYMLPVEEGRSNSIRRGKTLRS
jgi:hypothetical protein